MKNFRIWRDDINFSDYNETYTSADWFDLTNGYFSIIDPDGWDRKNYQYSFYDELITKEEFEKRVLCSTLSANRPTIKIETIENLEKDLEFIKNQISREIGYESFNDYMNNLIESGTVYSVERINKIVDEVALRYKIK